MPYTNVHRGARVSPRKVRPMVDLIRGKSVYEVQPLLDLSKRRAAVLVRHCLDAAAANAQAQGDLSSREVLGLVVCDAKVDQGPTMKRWRPKDRGRAHPINKRTSHITVTLDEPG